jgi:hypothetical protein
MAYNIFVGKQRSLVFPIMCNGFLTIDYSDNIVNSSDDIPYGLWALDDNFTFEAVVTPYDINGYSNQSNYGDAGTLPPSAMTKTSVSSGHAFIPNSKKIMTGLSQAIYTATTESNHQSEIYLPRATRLTHTMRIFHSSNFQVDLLNSTLHNENNPAEYKIRVGIKLGSATIEYFTTDAVILPNLGSQYKYSSSAELNGFNEEGKIQYRDLGNTNGTHSAKNIPVGFVADNYIFGGDKQEIFIRDGADFISLGTVNAVTTGSPHAITLTTSYATTIPSGTAIYIKHEQEPNYINNTYHIACSWDNENKEVNIFLNGRLVKTATHTQTDSFTMAAENFFIGADGQVAIHGAGTAANNKQFMGELHELSIMSIRKNQFDGLSSLLPKYNDTVLYLRFEEVDE